MRPPSQGTRPRRDAEEVRQAILGAALEIFIASGYERTGTDEVAARASVSKRTLYAHFPDKDALVGAAIASLITAAEAQGSEELEALRHSDDLDRDLRRFARQHIRDVITPEIMQVRRRLIGEADRFPELARRWYDAAPARSHATLAGILEVHRERGVLAFGDALIAAEHLNWLILSIPLNRAMFDVSAAFEADRYMRHAEAAIDVFMAAYGTGANPAGARS